MKKAEIYVIRLEQQNFNNAKTGEVREMTKITYAIRMANTDRTKGLALLVCYSNGKAFTELEKIIMKQCMATIEEKPTDNGSKYVLTEIDGIKLK